MACKVRALLFKVNSLLRNSIGYKAVILYLVTFVLILPVFCINKKYCWFYVRPDLDVARIREQELNTERVQSARSYLSSLSKSEISSVLANSVIHNIDIVISIITQARNTDTKDLQHGAEYLTQTVARFLKLFDDLKNYPTSFPYTVKLQMCNIDMNFSSFTEAMHLKQYVPMVTRFSKHPKKSAVNVLEKEKQDYVFCLNQSLSEYKPRYVLLVEDDTLPNSNFFEVLRRTLYIHLDHSYQRGALATSEEDTAYVKFYHPDRLLSYWSIEPERLTELFGVATLCGIIVMNFLKAPRSVRLYIQCTVYFALLFLAIGRAHVNSFRELLSPYLHTFSPAPSCCTPAILYPSRGGAEVVKYLNGTRCKKGYGKDSAMDTFIKTGGFRAYIVQPNTFTHIGMYSSLRKKIVHPSIL